MKTKRRDAADHLRSDADVIAYLEAAFEEGDSGVVAAALGDIVRAKGMTKVARQAGLGLIGSSDAKLQLPLEPLPAARGRKSKPWARTLPRAARFLAFQNRHYRNPQR